MNEQDRIDVRTCAQMLVNKGLKPDGPYVVGEHVWADTIIDQACHDGVLPDVVEEMGRVLKGWNNK